MPYGQQVLWPDHALQDSTNAALHGDLDLAKVASLMDRPAIVDTRNVLDPHEVRNAGLCYFGMGRR